MTNIIRKLYLLVEHLPEAALVGGAGWWISGNALCLPAALLAGWLIDIDHLLDFGWYVVHSWPDIDWSLLADGGYFTINDKVIVPLHSWEITLLLLAGASMLPQRDIWLSAAWSHGLHLLHDQLTYRVRLFGYSFLMRMTNGFRLIFFCKHD